MSFTDEQLNGNSWLSIGQGGWVCPSCSKEMKGKYVTFTLKNPYEFCPFCGQKRTISDEMRINYMNSVYGRGNWVKMEGESK